MEQVSVDDLNSLYESSKRKLDMAVSNIRMKLLVGYPFYGEVLTRLANTRLLTVQEAIMYRVNTACTDGVRILFSPFFVNELTLPQLNFVILHESYHILLMHPLRADSFLDVKDKYSLELWNEAGDFIINDALLRNKDEFDSAGISIEFPGDALLMKDSSGAQIDLSDKSTEDLYKELLQDRKEQQNNSSGSGSGNESGSESGDGSGDSSGESNDSVEEIKVFPNNDMCDDSEEDEGESNESNGNTESGENGDGENCDEGNGDGDDGDGDGDGVGGDDAGEGEGGTKGGHSYGDWADASDVRPDLLDKFNDDDLDNSPERAMHSIETILIDINSKGYSKMPGSFTRSVEIAKIKPKIRWDIYLRKFLSTKLTDETSYDHPDKRYLCHGSIMAGTGAEDDALNNISIYIDTSGSISDKVMSHFLAHAWKISQDFDCTLSVFFWHTALYGEYRDIEPDDFMQVMDSIEVRGGGTDVECVYRYIEESDMKSTAYIILTDGEFSIPKVSGIRRAIVRKTLLALLDTTRYDKGLDTLGKVVSIDYKETM